MKLIWLFGLALASSFVVAHADGEYGKQRGEYVGLDNIMDEEESDDGNGVEELLESGEENYGSESGDREYYRVDTDEEGGSRKKRKRRKRRTSTVSATATNTVSTTITDPAIQTITATGTFTSLFTATVTL